jgi:hypothetical protein
MWLNTTLKKKELCRTLRKGSVDFQKSPNVSKAGLPDHPILSENSDFTSFFRWLSDFPTLSDFLRFFRIVVSFKTFFSLQFSV